MARCVCCACVTDDDCCVDGYFFNKASSPCAGLNGPYATSAECAAAAAACRVFPQPLPICFCESIDNECCDDGVCRSDCGEELPP